MSSSIFKSFRTISNSVTLFFLFGLLSLASCDKTPTQTIDIDSKAMLENIGSNIVVSRYEHLNTELLLLEANFTTLFNDLNEANLLMVQANLLDCRLAWQGCSTFQFGPAETYNLKGVMNTYPSDTAQIENNINAGTTNLNSAQNVSAIGFPAIEYLLHGVDNNNADVLNTLTDIQRQTYLFDLLAQLISANSNVIQDWNARYYDSFILSTGTDMSSALGLMVNAMNADFERDIRDGKVGIPIGIRSLGTPLPGNTEAPYSGISNELLKESISKLQEFYQGQDGLGIQDYIEALNSTANPNLAAQINTRFEAILSSIDLLTIPMDEAVIIEEQVVNDLYQEMQQMIVLLKVDMSSSMGILITYQDNDGD